MAKALSSTSTSRVKSRKPAKAKAGKLTKARKAELLKQGYAAIDFFGTTVRLRLEDECLSSTDLLRAASAKLGKRVRLLDFLRSKDVQRFLAARSEKVRKRTFSDDPGEGPFLIERAGKGGLGWVERATGLRLAAWADGELESAVYDFVVAAHDQARPRKRNPVTLPLAHRAAPEVVVVRKDAHQRLAEFTDALPPEIGMRHGFLAMAKTRGLTGMETWQWRDELGEGWYEQSSGWHQALHVLAVEVGLRIAATMNPLEESPDPKVSRRKRYTDVFKAAGAEVRKWAEGWAMPWQPTMPLVGPWADFPPPATALPGGGAVAALPEAG